MAPWSPGSTVVVLGAGATRGAQFVHDDNPPMCLPPLNTDFFTQLQRITAAKHERDVANVLDDVLTLYGPNFTLTLEQYFTQLEAMTAWLAELVSISGGRERPDSTTGAAVQAGGEQGLRDHSSRVRQVVP